MTNTRVFGMQRHIHVVLVDNQCGIPLEFRSTKREQEFLVW